MRNIFTEKELEAGMFIVRNDAGKPFKDLNFARTVAFKVSYNIFGESEKWGICNFLTDGCFIGITASKELLADHFNDDANGFRQMTQDEVIQLVLSTEQGF